MKDILRMTYFKGQVSLNLQMSGMRVSLKMVNMMELEFSKG